MVASFRAAALGGDERVERGLVNLAWLKSGCLADNVIDLFAGGDIARFQIRADVDRVSHLAYLLIRDAIAHFTERLTDRA